MFDVLNVGQPPRNPFPLAYRQHNVVSSYYQALFNREILVYLFEFIHSK